MLLPERQAVLDGVVRDVRAVPEEQKASRHHRRRDARFHRR
jgi:hypothetical protein